MRRSLVVILLLALVAGGWALTCRFARAVPESSAIKDSHSDPALWQHAGPKHWRACLLQH